MADLTITAASVVPGSGATTDIDRVRFFGETVAAGKVVYLNTTTDKIMLADCTDPLEDEVYGIALVSGALNQPAVVQRAGAITLGAVLTVGETYVLSVAGGLAPIEDLEPADYVSIIGVATTTSSLQLRINNSGVQVPAPP